MRKQLSIWVFALILISLVLAACAPKATTEPPPPTDTPAPTKAPEGVPPDLSGETIRLYLIGDLSGPYAAAAASLVTGAIDMVAYYNESGGIFGAQIDLVIEDTGGKVDEAVAIYNRLTSEDDNILMMMLLSSSDQEALGERFKEDKIPVVGSTGGTGALYGVEDGWQFTTMVHYPDQFAFFLDYLVANWDAVKREGAGDEIKLAHVSWPGAFGQAVLTDEGLAYMESLGVEMVTNELYDPLPTADATTAILNAQAAGANVIWNCTLAFGPAVLLNDLHELGLHDQFVVSGCMMTMDRAPYAFLADLSYGDGLYATFPFAWWSEEDNPAIQLLLEIFEKYERESKELSIGRLSSQGNLDIVKYAIEQAILEVGFQNLNGQAVYDQLIQLKDYKVLGGLTTVDFTNGVRASQVTTIRQIQGGPDKFVIVQDFAKVPDLRPKP